MPALNSAADFVTRDEAGRFAPGHTPYREGSRLRQSARLVEADKRLAELETAGRSRKPDPPRDQVLRDELGRFTKGHAAYRNGGRRRYLETMREYLRGAISADELADLLVQIVRAPDVSRSVRSAATVLVMNYCDGSFVFLRWRKAV